MREATEESGLAVAVVSSEVLDLDIHEIPARKADPAHLHYDVRFLLRVQGDQDFAVSEESLALAWVPVDELGAYTTEESVLRLVSKARSRFPEAIAPVAGEP